METVSLSPRKTPRVALIREELVALTGDHCIAVVLNQMLYWTQRVKDFDLLLEEERSIQPNCNVPSRHGWIYKTAHELNEETMLNVDRTTMRRYLSLLVERGWLDERVNPNNKWDKTTQYRVNLRMLQKDLLEIGWILSGFDDHHSFSRGQSTASKEQHAPSNGDFTSSNVQNALSNGDNAPSNVRKCPLIYLTENTTETTNKDHTQRACEITQNSSTNPMERTGGVCEKFEKASFKKSVLEEEPRSQSFCPQPSQQRSALSIPEAMVQVWRKHVCQEVLEPNKRRSHLLEAGLQIHFQRDLKRWEAFCEHVKTVPFLMGKGPNGWHITLDWLLKEDNLLKVREGNYDPPEVREQKHAQLATTDRELQVRAILQNIKDPVWKKWCSQLAKGIRLNELTMLHKPLSIADLRDIANARFLECEDERLVWMGSADQRALNRIEDLRLDISWVFAKEFPNARAFRTRLISPYSPPAPEGESYA